MTVDTHTPRIDRSICTVRGKDAAWVAPYQLVEQPGLASRTEPDAVATFGTAQGWLAFGDEAARLALLLDRVP